MLRSIFIFLFGILLQNLYAQKPDTMYLYAKDWAVIDKFEYDGLPKSALEATQKLFERIKADKAKNPYYTAQYVKALLYMNKNQALLEEDGLVKAIYRLQQELDKAEAEVRPLLQSIMAQLYDQYLAQHLYKFRDRTATDSSFKQEDIRTWDVARINGKAHELYLASVQDVGTRQLSLDAYRSILTAGNRAEGMLPTLYDLLMSRALEFFRSERSYLTKPSYRFYIEQPQAFGNAKTFLEYKWESRDAESVHWQALQLFQEWLRFHAGDADRRAFFHADLQRLQFVYSTAVIKNKTELYDARLQEMAKEYADTEHWAEVQYLIARRHQERGNAYNAQVKDDPLRWEWKKAFEVCDQAIAKYPKSYGAELCRNLRSTLLFKQLNIQTERIVCINQSVLARIEYRNLQKVHLKVLRLTESQWESYRSKYAEEALKFLNGISPVQAWSMEIPDEKDYRVHSAEFKVPGMANGFYVIMASENAAFSYVKNGVCVTPVYVSNVAYMQRDNGKGRQEFFVVDRSSGAPLKGAKVDFFTERYNSTLRRYERIKAGSGTSDENGYVFANLDAPRTGYYSQSFRVRINYQGDELNTDDSFYEYTRDPAVTDQFFTQFFLDRTIYRPGQTVYFKGILLARNSDGKNPRILPNTSTTIAFLDANRQKVAEVQLTSNEFGSIQGSFTAPAGGLTGSMQLTSSHGGSGHSFRVEEYKRPKFEAKFQPIAGSFKVEEKVKVKGIAKAYAGNAIDEAKVQYRVTRQTSFPYWRWWYWGRYNPYNQSAQEIVFGEVKTNAAGEFEIEFDAIIDKTIPLDRQPVFTYTVTADVTDNTGETHSCNTTVRVGTVALQLDINLPSIARREDERELKISALNLNGQPEPAQGSIKIERLQTPSTDFVDRFWSKPDVFLMAEKDFKAEFPGYAYKNEDEIQEWAAVKDVANLNFDTKQSDKLGLNWKNWEQGNYKITVKSQDRFGTPVEIVRYFQLYSDQAAQVPSNTPLFMAQNAWTVEPGETIRLDFGSCNKEAYLLYEVEHDGNILLRRWERASERNRPSVEVEEKHRGNFYVHVHSIQNNRFHRVVGNINVPWTNKELNIEYASFRDKLLPGQDEEWRIKISGHKKDRVAAEFAASMYDASLDAFAPSNSWSMNLFPMSYSRLALGPGQNFTASSGSQYGYEWNYSAPVSARYLEQLNWFGFSFYEYGYYRQKNRDGDLRMAKTAAPSGLAKEKAELEESPKKADKGGTGTFEIRLSDKDGIADELDEKPTATGGEDGGDGEVNVRTNLNETVFFFPQLMTDAEGNVVLKFKMNEALTRWKFLVLAHTKDLQVGYSSREVVTQKDLMITPNAPRFFRQGDELYFTAKVANMTKNKLSGQATLQLFDATTGQPIDAAFENTKSAQSFEVEGERSAGLAWRVKVPSGWSNAVTHRVIAKSGSFSDGEESSLPVLTNQMLVTETMPLPVRGGQTEKFDFKRMEELSKSPTLRQHSLTLEFTPNPAWYALQALPYLMEYPYECTEQIFSRYYANSLASNVANAHPKIKKVFDTWRDYQPSALESNLTKNQELKYALIEETPWVLNAQSEAQQKRNIGVLFDLNRMAKELDQARDKMADRQLANGGFAWFPGGRDSWYITQYIVEGFGHLDALGVKEIKSDKNVQRMTSRAVNYTDDELARHYRELLRLAKESKDEKAYLAQDHLDYIVIHYLYARSFFGDQAVQNETTKKAVEYYENQCKTYWRNKSLYMKGMLALALNRKGKDKETPKQIVASLRENALNDKEMGMYWKYPSGYSWYELPIETHALMIEVFDEVAGDLKAVDDLKTWLLKAKQTTHWKTTKATASACYALLRRGDNWLLEDKDPVITLGKDKLDLSKVDKEAGTGYFKTTWKAADIKPEMGKVKVENPNKNVAWGAMYWQYFEDLDKITHFQETPLKIDKKLFKVVRTDRGEVLKPIENEKLVPGDLVKVRIEIRVDRSMEYVHLKDMRASGFEPVNVLSQYKYQGGLGYYESTKDMATHFFIDYLSKGTYVFEYPLRVNHRGDFSNGVTTMQCMYAPEFTSHSQGIRIKIESE